MIDGARSMFHANGGRFLEQGVNAPTELAALAWKYFAHLSIDLPYVVTLLLAIPGAALMRDRTAAALFAGWIVLNVALVAITGFGGARLRAPFEPHLMVMAGAVLAGGWRSRRVSSSPALRPSSSSPRSRSCRRSRACLRARGNYGVQWAVPTAAHRQTIRQRGRLQRPAPARRRAGVEFPTMPICRNRCACGFRATASPISRSRHGATATSAWSNRICSSCSSRSSHKRVARIRVDVPWR